MRDASFLLPCDLPGHGHWVENLRRRYLRPNLRFTPEKSTKIAIVIFVVKAFSLLRPDDIWWFYLRPSVTSVDKLFGFSVAALLPHDLHGKVVPGCGHAA